MRALNVVIVSSGFVAIFVGIGLLSAALTAAAHSVFFPPKVNWTVIAH